MKLELKHIAPYPKGKNGIKVITEVGSIGFISMISINEDEDEVCVEYWNGLDEWISISKLKIVTHPLSDLTKEIEHNREKFVPLRISFKEDVPHHELNVAYRKKPKDLLQMEYWFIQKLFEWHFDVFGLIEKGLAIDINTL